MRQMTLFVLTLATFAGSTLAELSHSYTNLNLGNFAFTENVLFNSPSVSAGHCALLCNWWCSCVTFTFYHGNCRGHDIQVNSSTPSESISGAQTFVREVKKDWLESPCSEDSDCTEDCNVECFKGLCLCTPGYFYSVSSYTCLDNCSSLHSSYTVYPGSRIVGRNTDADSSSCACDEICNADASCLNYECQITGDSCHTHNITAFDAAEDWQSDSTKYHFYQRNCV